jgi:hypothetical protein
LRVENGLGVVEDYEHLLGGKKGPQGCQILRVFDSRTDDLGETGEEMSARSRELIATDESTVLAKPFLDAIVVEDGEGDGCFPDPPCTDESDGFQVFSESDDLLDQLFASETGPWRRGRPSNNCWAHVEELKTITELLLPTANLLLINTRMNKSRDCLPFTLFGDLIFDPLHGSAIKNNVGEASKPRITGLTHVANRPTALIMNGLRSSSFFPFIARVRASHTSTQASPRST